MTSGRIRPSQLVVVIDEDAAYRAILAAALTDAGYRVVAADTADDGLAAATRDRAALIIVDGSLGADAGTDGGSLIRQIRLDAALRDVPCVLLTASGEPGTELRALDAGADALVRKAEVLDAIVTRIHNLLRARTTTDEPERPPPRILLVDDEREFADTLAARLGKAGYVVAVEPSGEAGIARLAAEPFDCVVLDLHMPGLGGEDTCLRIKAAPMVRDIPVVMLTALDDLDRTVAVLAAGADDLLLKSTPFRALEARLRAHIRRRQIEDDNRRFREALLAAEIEAAEARAARELAAVRGTMLDELARKNAELEAFAYSVSHDLRAPLRSITGFCRALVEDNGAQLDTQGHAHLQRVVHNAQRMNELIEDLLELSRVGRAELRRAQVDLSALARDVVGELQRRDPGRTVDAAIEDDIVVDADGKLLRIVLDNLVGNAWKFTGKVERAVIEISAVASPHGPAVCIRDNGAGFDPARADKLFQPFRRLHSERDYEGTGIGLATVHRIVDRHGGRVWADASPGNGAAFYFTLARTRSTAAIPPPRG